MGVTHTHKKVKCSDALRWWEFGGKSHCKNCQKLRIARISFTFVLLTNELWEYHNIQTIVIP